MRNLLRANFSRLWKSKIFWAGILTMVGLAGFVVWNQYDEMSTYGIVVTAEQPLFMSMVLMGVVSAVLVSLLVGVEYSDGTIRNKVIVGQTRCAVFVAAYVVSAFAVLVIYVLAVAVALVLGLALFEPPEISWPMICGAISVGVAMSLAYAAVYNLIAMVCSNRTYTAIICVLLSFLLMMGGTYVYNRLTQPEFIQQLAPITEQVDENTEVTVGVTEDGEFDDMRLETVPNPNYLSGAARERFQFFMDVNPTGQAMVLSTLELIHPVRIVLYDAAIVALCCLAGILIFRKKDIK